jgi:hypothetical protein
MTVCASSAPNSSPPTAWPKGALRVVYVLRQTYANPERIFLDDAVLAGSTPPGSSAVSQDTRRKGIVAIGPESFEPPVPHRGDQPAAGFADSAEGHFLNRGHGSSPYLFLRVRIRTATS